MSKHNDGGRRGFVLVVVMVTMWSAFIIGCSAKADSPPTLPAGRAPVAIPAKLASVPESLDTDIDGGLSETDVGVVQETGAYHASGMSTKPGNSTCRSPPGPPPHPASRGAAVMTRRPHGEPGCAATTENQIRMNRAGQDWLDITQVARRAPDPTRVGRAQTAPCGHVKMSPASPASSASLALIGPFV